MSATEYSRDRVPSATRDARGVPRVLVIDNYDSFVYNLVQYLGELGAEPVVHRHDAVTLDEMDALAPDAVLISPGPGPARGRRAVERRDPRTSASAASPVLGVCLGLQCIGELYGGDGRARAARDARQDVGDPPHGRRRVRRAARTRSPRPATTRSSSPATRCPTCSRSPPSRRTGLVMGLRHREFPIEGVQFHPESILTDGGPRPPCATSSRAPRRFSRRADRPAGARSRAGDFGEAVVERATRALRRRARPTATGPCAQLAPSRCRAAAGTILRNAAWR